MVTTRAAARRERLENTAARLQALVACLLVAVAVSVVVDPPAGIDGRALVALVLGGAWLAGLYTREKGTP